MEQTKALNALEPFVALSKSAIAPRAAADLVTQATSSPHTYVFTELLQTPQVQALASSPDHAAFLHLLEIFSYGTYTNYLSQSLPPLNDAQTLKLRQLSLLTLARDPQHNLSYASLQENLGLASARDVEELVISAVYAGLLTAQLDPRNGVVHISSVSHLRDIAPGSTPSTLSALRTWSSRCASTLTDLEAQINSIQASATARYESKKASEERQARLIEEEKGLDNGVHTARQGAKLNRALARIGQGAHRMNKRGSGSLGAGVEDDEAMDIDEDDADDGEGGSSGGAALSKSKRPKPRKH